MKPIDTQMPFQEVYNYGQTIDEKPEVFEKFKTSTVKGSQFKQPLFEFSGACAGCGETPYAKLVTQLYGDRMYDCQRNRLFFYLGRFSSIHTIHRE